MYSVQCHDAFLISTVFDAVIIKENWKDVRYMRSEYTDFFVNDPLTNLMLMSIK